MTSYTHCKPYFSFFSCPYIRNNRSIQIIDNTMVVSLKVTISDHFVIGVSSNPIKKTYSKLSVKYLTKKKVENK